MRGASVVPRLTPARVSNCHFCESRMSPNRACFVHYPLTQQNKIFESHVKKYFKTFTIKFECSYYITYILQLLT